MIIYFRQILHLLGEDRRKLPLLIFMFLASSLIDIIGLGLIGQYITLVLDPNALDSKLGQITQYLDLPKQQLLFSLGIVLLFVFLFKACSAIFIHYKIIQFTMNQELHLRSFLMQAYQKLPYVDYLQRNSSDYVDRIVRLTGQFSGGIVRTSLKTISECIVAVAILAFLAYQNILVLALLITFLGIFIFCYDFFFRKRLSKYGERSNTESSLMVQSIHESIEGLKEIRILGKTSYFYNKMHTSALKYAQYYTKNNIITLSPGYILEFILVVFTVTLINNIHLLEIKLLDIVPTMVIFGFSALRIKPIVNSISNSISTLRFNRDATLRLHDDWLILNKTKEKEMPDVAQKEPDESFRLIHMNGISYSYPNSNFKALDNINFDFRKGEAIGIIGKSGSGKTTLLDILLGLLIPQAGEIYYNNKSLEKVLSEWRSHVAYLPQQVFLIDNTLRRNIALGLEDEQIDEDRICEAVSQARLKETVGHLPNDLDTLIGERGVRLSGGQRQRVALARAFYHRRSVIVMDESTSSLDRETEQEIVDEIKLLKGQVTVIVIAHRTSTVKHCDRIYRLENGKIIEHGKPEQILRGNE
jgi:ATP-binding cassette, subfamily B, bacterial PglK